MNIQKFESHIERIPFSTCWYWNGPATRLGYGRFNDLGKRVLAHRTAYLIYKGQEAGRLNVCHHCDTPSCVNPEHLFLGTQQDNLADMRKKGRQRQGRIMRGEDHYEKKLTNEKVLEIRASYTGKRGQITQMAKTYKVSVGLIRHVVTRLKWKHI